MQQQQYGQPPRPAGVREGAMFNQQRNRYELPGGSVAGLNAFNDQAGVRPGAMFNQQRSRWELPGGSVNSMNAMQQLMGQTPQMTPPQRGFTGVQGTYQGAPVNQQSAQVGGGQQQPMGGQINPQQFQQIQQWLQSPQGQQLAQLLMGGGMGFNGGGYY